MIKPLATPLINCFESDQSSPFVRPDLDSIANPDKKVLKISI